MENLPNSPLARIQTADKNIQLHAKKDFGTFATHEEAEKAALEQANSPDIDTVIVQTNENEFHVYGIDELHHKLNASQGGRFISEAPIIAFVATDPLTGIEDVKGKRAANPESNDTNSPNPTSNFDIDKYLEKHENKVNKVLKKDKDVFIEQLRQYEATFEANGINIKIELDDDVFENRDKLEGYRNFLSYASANIEVLKERSISEISIVDEFDNWGGVKIDLDYNKEQGKRILTLGDDFLDDWGESGKVKDTESLTKLYDELGAKLTKKETRIRNEVYTQVADKYAQVYHKLDQLQQNIELLGGEDYKEILTGLSQELEKLEKDTLTDGRKKFKDFSVDAEKEIAMDFLDKFDKASEAVRDQLKALEKLEPNDDMLQTRGRIEKAKILLLKGSKDIPIKRNSLRGYVTSALSDRIGIPGAGLEYVHSFGEDGRTTLSARVGQTPTGSDGNTDTIFGIGFGHKISSSNKIADGTYIGVGLGVGINTPIFFGANVHNSWYLNDYSGQESDWSVVGGAYASVGTYNNIGAYLDIQKQVHDNVTIEGTGELSLLAQGAEIEAEFKLTKNKDFYLTGGVGTDKFLYAGIGIMDQYELEVGLGGISFGKDSNNLPGEASWEVGLRWYLPIPYFRHHKVPGYNFEYGDKSKEYITPKGTFMTIKEDKNGEDKRISYVLDPTIQTGENEIAYRVIDSEEDLKDLQNAPIRKLSLGPLGYLTVEEDGKKIIDDGLILGNFTNADIGIISDQAGVLWFDKRKTEEQSSLALRRKELPVPLFRPIYQ